MQYSSELFRSEAIEGQKKNNLGNAILLPKTNHQLLAFVILCWFVLFCALLIAANYTSTATVTGWLVSSKPSIDVIAKEPHGVITSAYVENGQHVVAGAPLLKVSRNASILSYESNREQIESLNKSRILLQDRKQILANKQAQQIKQDDGLIISHQQQLQLKLIQLNNIQVQIDEALLHEQKLHALWRNKSIDKLAHQNQKEKRQALQLQLELQLESKLNIDRTLLVLKQSKVSNNLDLEHALNSIASEAQKVKQEIRRLKGVDSYLIRSPIDGIVHNLQTYVGEPIGSNLPLMQITPSDNPLTARLYVPSTHAGFIQENQTVQMKMQAFPYQKFGMSSGTITHISSQILLPHQVKRLPIALSEPVFIAEVSLDKAHMNANGMDVELKAGMLFQAEIVLSKHKLWAWLLSPITRIKGSI